MTAAHDAQPNRSSKVYARAFNVALAAVLLLLEWFFRAATGESALAVIPRWFVRGSGVGVLTAVWCFATISFALLAAAMVRNVFVACTGRRDAYIYLGDQLSEGFHAVLENSRPWAPRFVPRFIDRAWDPSTSFHATYKRMWLIEDREGNLTPVQELQTWRTVGSMFLQGLALAASFLPCVVIAGMFLNDFPSTLHVPQAWAALRLPPEAMPAAIAVWAVANGVAILAIRRGVGSVSGAERALPLPDSVARANAMLPGVVVGTELYSTVAASRSRDRRYYRRFAVRFEGPDMPLPVFLNWQARRILDVEMTGPGSSFAATSSASATATRRRSGCSTQRCAMARRSTSSSTRTSGSRRGWSASSRSLRTRTDDSPPDP